jgi:hypothetical protein
MAKPLPTDLFAGFEYLEATDAATADSIAIPLTALPGLTAAEASATTGDAREVMLSLLTAAYLEHSTLPSPSSRMTIQRSEAITGDATRRIDFSVSFSVEVPPAAYVMQSEPA